MLRVNFVAASEAASLVYLSSCRL